MSIREFRIYITFKAIMLTDSLFTLYINFIDFTLNYVLIKI